MAQKLSLFTSIHCFTLYLYVLLRWPLAAETPAACLQPAAVTPTAARRPTRCRFPASPRPAKAPCPRCNFCTVCFCRWYLFSASALHSSMVSGVVLNSNQTPPGAVRTRGAAWKRRGQCCARQTHCIPSISPFRSRARAARVRCRRQAHNPLHPASRDRAFALHSRRQGRQGWQGWQGPHLQEDAYVSLSACWPAGTWQWRGAK